MVAISFDINDIDFGKGDGLVPAVVQHAENLQVLMLGYMNAEALKKTYEEGQVTFFSRSKKRLWTKGEDSGNFLNAKALRTDCDSDVILILALPEGPTCHLNRYACFGAQEVTVGFLAELTSIVRDRSLHGDADSYIKRLIARGFDKVVQKIGEEATEVVIEAKNANEKLFVSEMADLLFHMLVLCEVKEIDFVKVVGELLKRNQESTSSKFRK